DSPHPARTEQRLREKIDRVEAEAHVDVGLLGTVDPDEPVRELKRLKAAGACGLMVSLFEQDAYRYPKVGANSLRRLFEGVASLGLPVAIHPESDCIIKDRVATPGLWPFSARDPRIHGALRPEWSET